jgi:hypothetical protein
VDGALSPVVGSIAVGNGYIWGINSEKALYKKTPTTAWTFVPSGSVPSGSFVSVAAGDGGVVTLGSNGSIRVLKNNIWVHTDGLLRSIAVTNGFLFGVSPAGTLLQRTLTSL